MTVPGGPERGLVLSGKGTWLSLFWEAEGWGHEVAQDVAFKNSEECLTLGLCPQLAAGLMVLEGIRAMLGPPYEGSARDRCGQQELRRLGRLAWSCSVPACLGWEPVLPPVWSQWSEPRSTGHGRGLPRAAVRQCVVWVYVCTRGG